MANCAQLINCLNSLYLAHGDQFVVTPVGHVFEMYAPHQGNEGVRTLFSSPQVTYNRDGKQASFWGLKGAASARAKRLFLTVVNADISKPRETEIVLRGASATSGTASVLTNSDIHAYNSFQNKNVVRPVAKSLNAKGTSFVFEFPAASVSALQIELA
jgi:alpha-N-arabinofuranosidase